MSRLLPDALPCASPRPFLAMLGSVAKRAVCPVRLNTGEPARGTPETGVGQGLSETALPKAALAALIKERQALRAVWAAGGRAPCDCRFFFLSGSRSFSLFGSDPVAPSR